MLSNSVKQQIRNVINSAGEIILERAHIDHMVKKEGDFNFATEVDYHVQEFLTKELKRIIPGSNIIGEESETNRYSFDKPAWILDPVDGTSNMIHYYMHAAVSLALVLEGKLTYGIVYNPYNGEMYEAELNQGAWLNGKKIRVSERDDIASSLIAFGTTPYQRDKADTTFAIVKDVFLNCRDIRRSGAAALDLAYVAAGRLEGFFEMILQPWDYAAGVLIVHEAGGRVTDWHGNDASLDKPCGILASNGKVHDYLLNTIQRYL